METLFTVPSSCVHINDYKGRAVDVWFNPANGELYVERECKTIKRYISKTTGTKYDDIHMYRLVKPSVTYGTRQLTPSTTYVVRACDGKQIHLNKNELHRLASSKPFIQTDTPSTRRS